MTATTPRERLCDQLNRDAEVAARVLDPRRVVIERFHGVSTHPIELEITDDELASFVRSVDSADLDALWPGRPDEWKAFALLSVHLEELIGTSPTSVRTVQLVDGRIAASRRRRPDHGASL